MEATKANSVGCHEKAWTKEQYLWEILTVYTVEIYMSQEDAKLMAKDAHGVGRWTILSKYAEVGRSPEITIDEELFMTHAKTMKKQRQQHMSSMW